MFRFAPKSIATTRKRGSEALSPRFRNNDIFTLAGIYADAQYLGYVNFDPMRIAAAIVRRRAREPFLLATGADRCVSRIAFRRRPGRISMGRTRLTAG